MPKTLCIDGHGQRIYAVGTSIKVLGSDGKAKSMQTEGDVQSLAVTKQGILAAGLTVYTNALLCVLRNTDGMYPQDGKIQLFDVPSLSAHPTSSFSKNRGSVTQVSFSSDGNLLAAGDSNGKIVLYSIPDGAVKTTAWAFHTAKIASIAWSPSGTHAVSGSLDT